MTAWTPWKSGQAVARITPFREQRTCSTVGEGVRGILSSATVTVELMGADPLAAVEPASSGEQGRRTGALLSGSQGIDGVLSSVRVCHCKAGFRMEVDRRGSAFGSLPFSLALSSRGCKSFFMGTH